MLQSLCNVAFSPSWHRDHKVRRAIHLCAWKSHRRMRKGANHSQSNNALIDRRGVRVIWFRSPDAKSDQFLFGLLTATFRSDRSGAR